MPETSTSEIHRYPLRPSGFGEPLFATPTSRRIIGEHLLSAPWLELASELRSRPGETAHILEEPVELRVRCRWVEIVRLHSSSRRRCPWKRRRVVEVLDRWREVGSWWDEDRHTDRLVFRVLLSGDVVVDLARERASGWELLGVVD